MPTIVLANVATVDWYDGPIFGFANLRGTWPSNVVRFESINGVDVDMPIRDVYALEFIQDARIESIGEDDAISQLESISDVAVATADPLLTVGQLAASNLLRRVVSVTRDEIDSLKKAEYQVQFSRLAELGVLPPSWAVIRHT